MTETEIDYGHEKALVFILDEGMENTVEFINEEMSTQQRNFVDKINTKRNLRSKFTTPSSHSDSNSKGKIPLDVLLSISKTPKMNKELDNERNIIKETSKFSKYESSLKATPYNNIQKKNPNGLYINFTSPPKMNKNSKFNDDSNLSSNI